MNIIMLTFLISIIQNIGNSFFFFSTFHLMLTLCITLCIFSVGWIEIYGDLWYKVLHCILFKWVRFVITETYTCRVVVWLQYWDELMHIRAVSYELLIILSYRFYIHSSFSIWMWSYTDENSFKPTEFESTFFFHLLSTT